MKRLPPIPTIVVALAVAAMVALGVWQLGRAREKEALLALYRANLSRPAMTFPELPPLPHAAMFRRSSVMCLSVEDWDVRGGRAADGTTGYRHIARCRTGAEGPGAAIDMGVARDPALRPDWRGGLVRGIITTTPDGTSLIGRLAGRGVAATPMLVADAPAPGLQRSAPPSPENLPNNHLAYAGQWFLFAIAAALIYALALRRRLRAQAAGREGPTAGA